MNKATLAHVIHLAMILLGDKKTNWFATLQKTDTNTHNSEIIQKLENRTNSQKARFADTSTIVYLFSKMS